MNKRHKPVNLRAKPDKGKEENMKEQAKPKKQMTIRIAADVHKGLKIKVAEQDQTIGAIVEGLLRNYLVGTYAEASRSKLDLTSKLCELDFTAKEWKAMKNAEAKGIRK